MVTPEAIEAAARALCLLTYGVEWEHMGEAGRRSLREEATAALTAAALVLQGHATADQLQDACETGFKWGQIDALREAADAVEVIDPAWDSALYVDGAYHPLPDWLRARAATIDGKSE